MQFSRLLTGLSCVVLSGVAFGTIARVLPFQDPVTPDPNEHHERITKSAGHYEGTMSMSMDGMEWEGSCTETVTAIGDFWTVSHFHMEDMMGMPFSGSSTLGYDPEKDAYVGIWVDSSRPMITNMEGKWDEAKKAIVMEYDMFDGMTGEMVRMRNENVQTARGYTTTFYRLGEEEAEEFFQISMKRKDAVEAGSPR